jgi:hypothetical protein
LLLAAMHRLLHGDAGLEAVDHSAEAVLPLALADPPALQQAGEALLAACADGAAQARLSSGARLLGGAAACLPACLQRTCGWHATACLCLVAQPMESPPPLASAQASARSSFSELAAQVGAAAAMDRPARRAFAKALARFVTDARGALNVR